MVHYYLALANCFMDGRNWCYFMNYEKPLRAIGERGIIKVLSGIVPYPTNAILPFGDDVSGLYVNGKRLLLKVDAFSEIYSRYYWMDLYDLGWKAVTMVVSDFVVKLAKPSMAVVSFGAPSNRHLGDIVNLFKGLSDAAKYYNLYIVGGDTNESRYDLWISISAISLDDFKYTPSRFNAKVGDIVVTSGEYGITGLANYIHYNRIDIESLPDDLKKKVLDKTKRPIARVDLLDKLKEIAPYITSSIDVSDGLVQTLYDLSEASNVTIELDNIPIDPLVKAYAEENKINAVNLALHGGEEFEVIFTISQEQKDILHDLMSHYNLDLHVIGKVVNKGEVGVYLRGHLLERKGWEYFR